MVLGYLLAYGQAKSGSPLLGSKKRGKKGVHYLPPNDVALVNHLAYGVTIGSATSVDSN